MKAHLAYLKTVLRHKYYVYQACRLLGVPWWIAVVHDWRKFFPRQWFPYVKIFHNPDGSKRTVRDRSGAYDPGAQADSFKRA